MPLLNILSRTFISWETRKVYLSHVCKTNMFCVPLLTQHFLLVRTLLRLVNRSTGSLNKSVFLETGLIDQERKKLNFDQRVA